MKSLRDTVTGVADCNTFKGGRRHLNYRQAVYDHTDGKRHVQAQRKELHVNAMNQILRILPIPENFNGVQINTHLV
jgi:hypothetical protein